MFQQPSQGDRVDVNELVGCLCLFYVREVREGINTPYGEREAIACDIHVLDGRKGGEKFENSLIFQSVLIGSLRYAAGGDPVLGRIGQGISKPGQKPPFTLLPFTDADAALATGYIQRMAKPFKQPENGQPASPPAAAGARPGAATPSPAASSASANGPVTVDISTLPPEVQELLRQTGAVTG